MDGKDRQILDILKEDGRASYTEIAEEIDVSEGTVRNRVESMQDEGVIEKFTVDTRLVDVSAIVMVDLSTSIDMDGFFSKLPSGIRAFEVTGGHDVVLYFSRSSSEEVNSVLDKIRGIEGVEDTTTKSVLKNRSL
ncbi:Lrp/AsnC family transcriptional regulator [Candidatus Nanohalobium constans]|uniref:Lrp/AsnC family transcriptional regulator n=1 Tax=Candidatus Nanohalobium constans TaxID=2565781 RepID=A0A5Q0UHS1_9ARCH|nr:Lrp/AsnC family transcriptional regulator [Candidatus Nanohalobium constans]QGA80439.1 Lrp/AsnC family transcriptional regulator [Candidatus Nanohalobium constans]